MSLPDGISVIVPVYNSEKTLSELVERLEPVLKDCQKPYRADPGQRRQPRPELGGHPFAVPVLPLGARRQPDAQLRAAQRPAVRAARWPAMPASVTIDDDLQHPPEEIPRLLAKLEEGEDVVYGTPIKQAHTLWRNLASYFTRLALQGTMGLENARKVSAFRALRTQVRQAFEQLPKPVRDPGRAAHLGHHPLHHRPHPP